MSIQRHPMLAWAGIAIVAIIVAIVIVVSRAPTSDLHGTAPSSLTGAPCEGMTPDERRRCLEAYSADHPQSAPSSAAGVPSASGAGDRNSDHVQ